MAARMDATPSKPPPPRAVAASPGQPEAAASLPQPGAPESTANPAATTDVPATAGGPKAGKSAAAGASGGAAKRTGSNAMQQQLQAPEPVPIEPEVAHRNTIVASTFANLELQNAQTTLRQYTQLYDAAIAENERLADLLRERDRDAMQVVDYLRTQLEEHESRARAANLRSERAEADFEAKHKARLDALKADVADRDDTICSLRSQLREAHDRLDDLAHFQQDKQQLLMHIARLKEGDRDRVLAHEKEMTKVKFASLEEKVKLRAVEKAMTDKFDGEVNERAMQLVDTKTQQIRESNVSLIKQKAALEREVQRLTAAVRSATEGMDAAKREADLARESHAEYARQGCKLTRVARDASKRVRELEARSSDLTRELQTQQVEGAAKRDSDVAVLKDELRYARDAGATLKRQLVQMRALTAQVLGQRSDLENFFHEALEFTRAQQGKLASGGDSRAVGASLDAAMSPRVAAGYRGDLDARTSVKQRMYTSATTTKPAFMTQALTPRGDGTFLAKAGQLEGIGSGFGGGGGSKTPRGRGEIASPRGGGASRPSTRGTLPHVATATPLSRPPRGFTDEKDRAEDGGDTPQTTASLGSPPSAAAAPAAAAPGSFAALSWADKEKIIAALLLRLNNSFYNAPPPNPNQQLIGGGGGASSSHRGGDVLTLDDGPRSPTTVGAGAPTAHRGEPAAAAAPLTLEDYRHYRPPRPGAVGGGSRPSTRDGQTGGGGGGRAPLPEQRPDEDVAEWGSSRPGTSGRVVAAAAGLAEPLASGGSRAGMGTPAGAAVAFPSAVPRGGGSAASGVLPPQPPPTATGGQRIQRLPSSATPSSAPPSAPLARSALRRSAPSSARSSAGSHRHATFAGGGGAAAIAAATTMGPCDGDVAATAEGDFAAAEDPVVE